MSIRKQDRKKRELTVIIGLLEGIPEPFQHVLYGEFGTAIRIPFTYLDYELVNNKPRRPYIPY